MSHHERPTKIVRKPVFEQHDVAFHLATSNLTAQPACTTSALENHLANPPQLVLHAQVHPGNELQLAVASVLTLLSKHRALVFNLVGENGRKKPECSWYDSKTPACVYGPSHSTKVNSPAAGAEGISEIPSSINTTPTRTMSASSHGQLPDSELQRQANVGQALLRSFYDGTNTFTVPSSEIPAPPLSPIPFLLVPAPSSSAPSSHPTGVFTQSSTFQSSSPFVSSQPVTSSPPTSPSLEHLHQIRSSSIPTGEEEDELLDAAEFVSGAMQGTETVGEYRLSY